MPKKKQDPALDKLDAILAELKRIQTPTKCPGIHLELGNQPPVPMPSHPMHPGQWPSNTTPKSPWWGPPYVVNC